MHSYVRRWTLTISWVVVAVLVFCPPSFSRLARRAKVAATLSRGQGVGARIPIPGIGGSKKQTVAQVLAKAGPLLPLGAFVMSSFSLRGFVKGDWPVVIEYELEADSTAAVNFVAEGVKEPFVVPLEPTGGEPRQVIHRLPAGFGREPGAGVVSFLALKKGRGELARFFLYGLGVGDRAVGSMVIQQLEFRPQSIRPKRKEKASYSFRSLSDFDTVNVDFRRTVLDKGVYRSEFVGRQKVGGGLRRGQTVSKEWDGKDEKGKVSPGPHQYNVRAWRGLKNGGDWVFACTRDRVLVEP